MKFLTFNTEAEADTAMTTINSVYGCPYLHENGYRMDSWSQVRKSTLEDKWGLKKPRDKLGKTVEEVMADVESVLQKLFKEDYEPPATYHVTRWKSDPYSRGSYSFVKTGISDTNSF